MAASQWKLSFLARLSASSCQAHKSIAAYSFTWKMVKFEVRFHSFCSFVQLIQYSNNKFQACT